MINPPSEIRAQALALKGRDRLVTLMAMRLAFPFLQVDLDWGDAIAATRRRLRLKPGEEAELGDQVKRMAAELKRQLGGG